MVNCKHMRRYYYRSIRYDRIISNKRAILASNHFFDSLYFDEYYLETKEITSTDVENPPESSVAVTISE